MAIKIQDVTIIDNNRDITNARNATFTGTDGITLPSGTDLERPVSPSVGTLRFNTDSNKTEVYNGTSFSPIGGSGGSSITSATLFYMSGI